MKVKNVLVALICAVICGLSMTSCENVLVVKVYSLGITQFSSSGAGSTGSDLSVVQEYLVSKGCPVSGDARLFMVEDKTLEKCDAKAVAKFNELTKNLSREEISALVSKDCTFTYSCSRTTSSPDEDAVHVAEWKYPE